MDIKEIAKRIRKTNNSYMLSMSPDIAAEFAEALIESYKAELLKEVQGGQPDLGEPVAYMTTDEEGSASMLFFDRAEALKYSGDDEPVNLFTESQLQAAQKELNQCSGLLDDSLRSIEMLEDQLAKAEQRVAEACAKWIDGYAGIHQKEMLSDTAKSFADALRRGEYRKFVKEV